MFRIALTSLAASWTEVKETPIDREDKAQRAIVNHLSRFIQTHPETVSSPLSITYRSYESLFLIGIDDARKNRLFLLTLRDAGGPSIDLDCKVAPEIKGHHVGALGLKAGIGVAFARNKKCLFFRSVEEDGLSFWPSVGALPCTYNLEANDYHRFADENAHRLSTANRQKIVRLGMIAKESVLSAWRLLSQTAVCFHSGEDARRSLFERLPEGGTQVLLLGEPETADILRKKLGVLPPAPAVPPRFEPMVKELERARLLAKNICL